MEAKITAHYRGYECRDFDSRSLKAWVTAKTLLLSADPTASSTHLRDFKFPKWLSVSELTHDTRKLLAAVFEPLSNFGTLLGYDCDTKINPGNKGYKTPKCQSVSESVDQSVNQSDSRLICQSACR